MSLSRLGSDVARAARYDTLRVWRGLQTVAADPSFDTLAALKSNRKAIQDVLAGWASAGCPAERPACLCPGAAKHLLRPHLG